MQGIKARKVVTFKDCESVRSGCEEIRKKSVIVDKNSNDIAKLQEFVKVLAPINVVADLKNKVSNLDIDVQRIHSDFLDGKMDRKAIRENMETMRLAMDRIASHIRNTNQAIRVYIRMVKTNGDGNGNKEALDELLKIFNGDEY